MSIEQHKIPAHLSYFLCIEDDLLRLSRWIEFSHDNATVYSIELARLLMTASAEVDVVAKALCKSISPADSASDIDGYRKVLTTAVPTLPCAEMQMPRFGMSFTPWSNWDLQDKPKPPDWWSGNNKVKHHRAVHFKQANLTNVLNATAGLLQLLLLLFSKDFQYLSPAPRLFLPHHFAITEGESLRLLLPDGTQLPWC